MMNWKMILLAGAAVLMVVSCGDDPVGPGPGPTGDWLPLSVGNWWTGELSGYMSMDADTVDLSGSSKRLVTALLDHSGGFQVYEFRTIMEMNFTSTEPDTSWTWIDTNFVYIRNTGDEMRGYDDTLSTDYTLLAPLPFTLGETWNPDSDSSAICEMISLTASISVPAADFTNCAIIRETDPGSPDEQMDTYFHRGTGILSEQVSEDGVQFRIDLESYSVQ